MENLEIFDKNAIFLRNVNQMIKKKYGTEVYAIWRKGWVHNDQKFSVFSIMKQIL